MFPHQAADAGAFRTEHQRDVTRRCGFRQAAIAIAGQRDAPEAMPGQVVERARDVHHFNIGNAVQGAGSGFGQSAGLRRRMAVLDYHCTHLKGRGGTQDGTDITCVQIAGLVARRILCYANESDSLARGQRYGFIRFGSRVDVYLPTTATSKVSVGDVTMGGVTSVAELNG